MSEVSYMSQEGYDRLMAELAELKTTERYKISEAIGTAIEQGDISENAEYEAAKDAQGLLELKINELEKSLVFARIVDISHLDTSQVTVLAKVKIKNLKVKKEFTYTIVSEAEADLKTKKISIDSPLGKGLIGKSVGDIANVITPGGTMQFEILDISL